jgi:nucleoside-diphosphate-sugar epimerase
MEYIDMGLNAYIVRPTIAYGRGDNGFPSTLVALVRRRMLLLPSRENRIHLIDVEKLADVFVKIMTTENRRDRIFIAADASAISCRELADMIHTYFYGKPYPSYLTLPDFVFNLLSGLFSFMRSDKWLLRILLISRSWYFDSTDTATKLALVPSETREGFKLFLTHLGHPSNE